MPKYLKPKPERTEVISIRLPNSQCQRWASLRQRAKKLGVDISQSVGVGVVEMMDGVEKELTQLEAQHVSVNESGSLTSESL